MQGILGTQRGNELIWTAPSQEDQKVRHVFFGLAHFCSYHEDDLKTRNVLVGLLGGTPLRRNVIAEAFGINRCMVPRYTKEMVSGGVEGLVRDGRGRPGKVTAPIEEFVRKEFKKLYRKSRKNFTKKLIAGVKKKFGVDLSRELIRQIIKPLREAMRGGSLGKEEVVVSVPAVCGPRLPVLYEDVGSNGRELTRQLEVGLYSRYAGGLLLNVFIARLTEGIFEDSGQGREHYSLKTFALMVMEMVQFDIVNLERVKRLYRGEFGLLVGKAKSPTPATMRRKLDEIVGRVDTDEAMVRLARNYIENLAPESGTFYVDDHFAPYWGKEEVLIGFSNLYHCAMEGTQHCFVHDAAGNPVFFSLRDPYHSFNEVLPEVASRLKSIVGPDRNLRLVFDRGGYDRKVFNKLGRMDITYCVWVKGDKSDYEGLGLEYEEEIFFLRRNRPEKPREVKIGIGEISLENEGRGAPKRKIVLRRKAGRRLKKVQSYMYSAFVTNDEDASRRDLVNDMIFRWRQECDFKMEKGEFGLDQITSYLVKGYREGAHEDIVDLPREEVERKLAKNPDLKPLRRRKRQIKEEISKIDEELGKRVFSDNELDLRTVEEVALARGNAKLLRKRKKRVSELKSLKEQMKALPKKVRLLDLLKKRDAKRLDFRKKLLMDILKVAARNARHMALGVLDKHYKTYRDQIEFLRRLIRSGGQVKLGFDGQLIVSLTRMDTQWENKIAKAFLEEINSLNPILLGTTPMGLKFRLGR